MKYKSPVAVFCTVADWIMETCGLRQSHKSERQRLANLSMKHHHDDGAEEIGAHTVSPAVHDVRALSGDDKDNYLGHLIRGRDVIAENQKRNAVNHWLHQGECLGCKTNGTYQHHDCGLSTGVNPQIQDKSESRLVDFSEIGLGLGLDLDCLSCFVKSKDGEDAKPRRETGAFDAAGRKTVQDLPGLQFDFNRVEKIQADAANRHAQVRES